MNNLPKVVAQQRRGWASNPRLLDRKSDALPLSHHATRILLSTDCIMWANVTLVTVTQGKSAIYKKATKLCDQIYL